MKKLSKSRLQVIVLYLCTLLGLLLGVVVSVINTRSLDPELYGSFRYVQNIISFISSILLFGFFTSGSRLLAISNNEDHSSSIRGAMMVILSSTIVILMLCMGVLYLININMAPQMANLYLISIPVCGNILMLNYINTTAQGDNHIFRIAFARILPSVVYILLAFLCYRLYDVTPELMLILYNGSAVLVLGSIILSTKPSFVGLKAACCCLIQENKSYGFNVYMGSLMGVSTQYLVGITLGLFCNDNANVGFYTLALTISSPLAMLPTIVGTTYFKRFATESQISPQIMYSTIFITMLSCLIYCLLIKYVVAFLYDSSYSSVSRYAQCLAIGMCFHGFGDMINRFLGAHGKGAYLRNAAISCGFVAIIGSFLGVYAFQIQGAIVTKILSSLSYMLVLLYYYRRFTKDQTL